MCLRRGRALSSTFEWSDSLNLMRTRHRKRQREIAKCPCLGLAAVHESTVGSSEERHQVPPTSNSVLPRLAIGKAVHFQVSVLIEIRPRERLMALIDVVDPAYCIVRVASHIPTPFKS